MENLEQKHDSPKSVPLDKEQERWEEFEPNIRISGIPALIRNWNVEVDEQGNIIKTMQERRKTILPRIEKHALIILCGNHYGYGGHVQKEGGQKEYIKKIPQENEENVFSKTYFALQKLVSEGILTTPETGNDAPTLNDFIWQTTKPMETAELVFIIRQKTGLSIEK